MDLLHRESIYHRDIAPDNILIEAGNLPVLLDFGAARRVIGEKSQALTAILKPAYAPIEQYGEAASVKQGAWTDLYALGATMHFYLLGQAPPPSTARAVQDEMQPLAERGLPGCSKRFLQIIDWMLAPRPADRPQSVAALRARCWKAAPSCRRRRARAPPAVAADAQRTQVLPPPVGGADIAIDVRRHHRHRHRHRHHRRHRHRHRRHRRLCRRRRRPAPRSGTRWALPVGRAAAVLLAGRGLVVLAAQAAAAPASRRWCSPRRQPQWRCRAPSPVRRSEAPVVMAPPAPADAASAAGRGRPGRKLAEAPRAPRAGGQCAPTQADAPALPPRPSRPALEADPGALSARPAEPPAGQRPAAPRPSPPRRCRRGREGPARNLRPARLRRAGQLHEPRMRQAREPAAARMQPVPAARLSASCPLLLEPRP